PLFLVRFPFLPHYHRHHPHLHSFPTRRSSDLTIPDCAVATACTGKSCSPTGNASVSAAKNSWSKTGVISVGTLALSVGNMTCQRSEEHTSELQSRFDLVCRLLLEKKNYKTITS